MSLDNIVYAKPQKLPTMIAYESASTKILKLIDNSTLKIAFISLDVNCEIQEHITTGDALYYCIEGKVELTSNQENLLLTAKDAVVISRGKKHGGKALMPTKLMLIVIRTENVAISCLEKDQIIDIKSIVDNSTTNLDLVQTNDVSIMLKDLDDNEVIERIVGNEEVLLVNLEGESDIKIDDNYQRFNSENLIVVANNTIYSLETSTSTKVIMIKINSKL